MNYRTTFPLVVLICALVSFLFQLNIFKLPNFRYFDIQGNCPSQKTNNFEFPEPTVTTGHSMIEPGEQTIQIIRKIEQLIPSVTLTHVDNATCAKKISVSHVKRQEKYCVGDSLIFRLDTYDYAGQRKKHGGDLLRARIYSPKLEAGASGNIEDFNNGSYLVSFTLFWEGRVHISILLMHPSEVVSGLWRARNSGYDNIQFLGMFANATHSARTECNFALQKLEGRCLHLGKMGEFFYCIKPEHLPCETLINMQSFNRAHSYLSDVEKRLLTRDNIGVEIPKPFEYIDVFQCNKTDNSWKKTCKIGMQSPFPSGYFLNNIWHPVFCKMMPLENMDQKRNCLAGKMIYLMGDSTLRQWISHCTAIIKTLKYYNLHRTGLETKLLALDMEKNILLQWKRHGYPYIASQHYSVKDPDYVAQAIDQLPGGGHFIIVINLGQHFRPFPIDVFIRRALDVRSSVERLFLRSPDTKVIIKAENTREMTIDQERFSDFHGYVQYLAVKEIFEGLNVGMVDAWDMTIAFATNNVHPAEVAVRSQVDLFLTYVC
ncbi:NXPE family member 1-like [Ambystoma mexicanum]|uniref:NXPE family member 1-like n=1 Tax=Ambystoma mexicanum TaxID=8296 RepID=UPI0037E7D8F2